MTKIDCKKGVCRLVPSSSQVGRGLYSRPTYYLIPAPKNAAKIPTRKTQRGSGKPAVKKSPMKGKGRKKRPKKNKKTKATRKPASKKPTSKRSRPKRPRKPKAKLS